MWSIRVLTGPQSGKIYPLKKGKNRIGRSSSCDIRLASNGVSKDHYEISILNDKILVSDLGSSNGTFLNGARIQNSILHLGDKLSFHETIVDIIPTPAQSHSFHPGQSLPPLTSQGEVSPSGALPPELSHYPPPSPGMPEQFGHPPGYGQAHDPGERGPSENYVAPNSLAGLGHNIKQYIEDVALPGVYKLGEVLDFPYILAGFVLLFILLVTTLSVIPMIQITQESIEKESRRRALTIARNLAAINQQALLQGVDSALTTDSTRLEEGVKEALIVSHADGSVIAPPERAGSYVDIGFIHQARREAREYTEMVDSSTIGAAVPISQYNTEVHGFSVKAHAIVLYNMGTLAVDDGRALSLFIQTFVIAILLGSILFYFLLKLIEYPIRSINQQVDKALREKRDDTALNFRFDVMQALISNINSALTRAISGDDGGSSFIANRDAEAENLVQLVGYPCIAINKDYLIVAANSAFEMLTGASAMNIQNQELSALPDQALQKNIDALLDISAQNLAQIATDELEFGGDSYLLSCQAIVGVDSTPEYYVLTISPSVEVEGGAA